MPTFAKAAYVWDGTQWVPIGVQSAAIISRWTYTATGGETTLSGNDDNGLGLFYTPGYEQVYLNGILLTRTEDYIASTGTTITGLTALVADDIIQILTLDISTVDDTYTQNQANSLFATKVELSGAGLNPFFLAGI